MAPKVTDNRIRPCEGPCQRMTRTTKMRAEDHPGTVPRANATHCGKCWDQHLLAGGIVPSRQGAQTPSQREMKRRARAAKAEQAQQEYERLCRERAARGVKRMVRPVRMGQSMVRI